MAVAAIFDEKLIPAVDRARDKTRRVVAGSESQSVTFRNLLSIALGTLLVKCMLFFVVLLQARLIASLIKHDFSALSSDKIRNLATQLCELVEKNRDLLNQTNKLGVEIRFWWRRSLRIIEGQMEHLDSIAESLYVASDDEASALLAMAVGHMK